MSGQLKVINVVGARPNFMKVAPVVEAMRRRAAEFAPLVVHTGQHYDERMSAAFFRDLALPEPDVYVSLEMLTKAPMLAPRPVRITWKTTSFKVCYTSG